MKVRVTLTLEVDPDTWVDIYGILGVRRDVRGDVLNYVENQVQQSAAAEQGAILSVEAR
jgi:hypothetical protein